MTGHAGGGFTRFRSPFGLARSAFSSRAISSSASYINEFGFAVEGGDVVVGATAVVLSNVVGATVVAFKVVVGANVLVEAVVVGLLVVDGLSVVAILGAEAGVVAMVGFGDLRTVVFDNSLSDEGSVVLDDVTNVWAKVVVDASGANEFGETGFSFDCAGNEGAAGSESNLAVIDASASSEALVSLSLPVVKSTRSLDLPVSVNAKSEKTVTPNRPIIRRMFCVRLFKALTSRLSADLHRNDSRLSSYTRFFPPSTRNISASSRETVKEIPPDRL